MRNFFKFISVLSISFGISLASYGKVVDESTAKIAGTHFLVSNGVPGVQSPADLQTVYSAIADAAGGGTITSYYVFNINGGTGFVMVSGDDLVIPILAYSTEASFEIEKISPAAKRWIDGYKNEIAYVVEHALPAQPGTPEKWSDLKLPPQNTAAKTTAVSPLITTLWDQAPWYNYLCPGSGSGKAVTGCVATAMAQIMKFWNWPTVGTGFHNYTSVNYGALSANFGNTVYNWTGMPNYITVNNNAVATLMLHAGISVDMDYSATESGAYVISLQSPVINCAEFAFKTYFHYKPTLKGIPRSGGFSGVPAPVSTAAWTSMLKSELDAGRPVFYSGASVTAGGHAWVCDGYTTSNLMHFNWGWGGTGPNGNYSVDAIAPPALGIGGGGGNFNSNQTIIIGITPDPLPSYSAGELKMLSHVSFTTNSAMPYLNGFSVVAKVLNPSSGTISGDFSAQAFDVNNNLVGILQTISGQSIPAGDSSSALTFTTPGLIGMIPGSYGINIMYRPNAGSTWVPVANNGTFINYNMMSVINSQSMRLYDSLHVGNHTLLKGQSLTINTKIANVGSAGFSGTIQAALYDIYSGTGYMIEALASQTISSNAFKSFTFNTSNVSAPSGKYVLVVQHKAGTAGSTVTTGSDYYQNPVFVTVVSGVDVNTPTLAAEQISVYPNPANDVINIDLKGVEVNEIHISDVQGRELKTITPGSNTAVIAVPVTDFAPGLYFVQFKSGNEVVTKKIVIAK